MDMYLEQQKSNCLRESPQDIYKAQAMQFLLNVAATSLPSLPLLGAAFLGSITLAGLALGLIVFTGFSVGRTRLIGLVFGRSCEACSRLLRDSRRATPLPRT